MRKGKRRRGSNKNNNMTGEKSTEAEKMRARGCIVAQHGEYTR